MFEEASKLKLRFSTDRGMITIEDLWDMPLLTTTGDSLDSIAKSLNKALKESREESFIVEASPINKTIELKFEVVKHIIKCKLADVARNNKAAENKAKKEQLLSILADKEDDALKKKSPAQIKKMIEEL